MSDVTNAAQDRATFSRFVREWTPYAGRALRWRGVRPSDLEDQMQVLWTAVWNHWSDFDHGRPPGPWISQFARFVASDYRRSASTRRLVADDTLEPEDGAARADDIASRRQDLALVQAALDTLEPERREVFVQVQLEERPMPEVCAALDVPLNTAYSRLRLAREDFTAAVRRLQAARGHR